MNRRSLTLAPLASALLALAACSSDHALSDGGPGDSGTSCAKQCDCPASTICSISGTCVGTATVAACGAGGSCPCGFTCVDGFCPPFVGSLAACTASCQCGNETCVGGECVAASSGDAGTCTSNTDCSGCSDTVCLLPGFPAMCAPPSRCTQDLHCLRDVGAGEQCICSDGTTPHEECSALGTCAAIPGHGVFASSAFTLAPAPSGQCVDAESSALTVSGVSGAPSSLLIYLAATGVMSEQNPPIVSLRSPSGDMVWSGYLYYQGASLRLIEAPLSPVPSVVNGTWKLCNVQNVTQSSPVVTQWGLYVQ